jgi:hypothetical protein
MPCACDRGSSGVGWSVIIFIASDSQPHLIYIYMPRPYLYLTLSLHIHLPQLRTRCAGEEAVCRAPVLARSAVRWAWSVGSYGPVPPCPSDHAKSERTRSALALALAAVGALQLRRSRYDGGTSRCAGIPCKRTYRYIYHLWSLS